MIKILSVVGSSRRKRAVNEVKKLNIKSWSFYDAIPVNDIEKYNSKFKKDSYIKSLSDEEKSCAISHYNIIVDNSTYVVFEDDFKLLKSCNLQCIVDEINNIAEPVVVILGHSKTSERDFWLQNLKQPLVNKKMFCCKTVGENYKINFYGAVGYLVNESFKQVVRKLDKIEWLADDWLKIKKITGCKIYHLKEKIIIEDINEQYVSSIGNKVHFRHDTRKKLLINLMKAFRAQFLFLLYKKYFDENSNNT
jgi:GR25 family glycosyltransferase involved in LPS biosynthesis